MMPVVFAVIGVALVAAVVVVFIKFPLAGRAVSHQPDAPITSVPEGRMTVEDIRNVRFPVVFRGYRPDDVDAYLDRVEVEIQDLQAEIAHLRAQTSPR